MIRSALIGLATLVAAACSPQETASPASNATEVATSTGEVHPVSGLAVTDLQVMGEETTHNFEVELALSPEAQARGLMFRTELGPNEGMLFPSAAPEQRSFWMKNTPLSLDIIFVGADGRISNIAAKTEPYSLQPVASSGYSIAVLELIGGRAAELGIKPGDRVVWNIDE